MDGLLHGGVTYQGGQAVEMYRTLHSFPVLVKAGRDHPMDDDPFAAAQENPKALTLRVCPGASNTFTLYEDDNKTEAYRQRVCAKTHITYTEGDVPTLTVAAEGDLSLSIGAAGRWSWRTCCLCRCAVRRMVRRWRQPPPMMRKSTCCELNCLSVPWARS